MGRPGAALGLLVLLTVCPVVLHGWTFDNVDTLATALMANYNKKLRPFVDDQTPLTVHMGLWLASVVDLNEISQELLVSGYIYMDWVDPKLTWTPATYNGTMYFAYPQENLWHPDITIINAVNTLGELGFDKNAMYLQSDGTVQWTVSGVYSVSCDIDVTFYPFDTQECTIIFSTLVSAIHEIELSASPSFAVDLSMYSKSGTWDLLDVDVSSEVDSSGKSREAFAIKLKRLRTYYVISIIFPILFLAFTVTLVFLLPNESGEKMGLSMTVLLAYAVYLTLLSDHMPQTSLHVSIMAVYLNVVLGQCALGVMASVWLINLYFRDDEEEKPPRFMLRLAVKMQSIMRWRKKKTATVDALPPKDNKGSGEKGPLPANGNAYLSDVDNDEAPIAFGKGAPGFKDEAGVAEAREEMKWAELAKTFDRFLFVVFSLSLVLLTIIFFLILAIGAEFYM